MIPKNIKKKHVLSAIREIDKNGVPAERSSRKYHLHHNSKNYPPKYVIGLANEKANGVMLESEVYSGGRESNDFLISLGFKIKGYKKAKDNKPSGAAGRHNERCPKCKKTIKRLLQKLYGNVRTNYKIRVSPNIEDYRHEPFYKDLKRIYSKLQKHRGHYSIFKAKTLPNCDYYVTNPGFVVEFDESQHFTLPRKIALQNYPKNIKLQFPRKRWMDLCHKINARDNSPVYRDEQRAWYDTLRDFLPFLNDNNPTVRLFSKEMEWCSLNPNKKADLERFRKIFENKITKKKSWIATVVLESDGYYTNNERLKAFEKIIGDLTKNTKGDGVVLFPGGWFRAGRRKAKVLYDWVEQNVSQALKKTRRNIISCIGIDGRETSEWSKDQMGVAITKKGIIAIGRKFHPAPSEKDYVDLADDYLAKEDGMPRIFEQNRCKFFMCSCYDSFGIKHKKLPKIGAGAILDMVHAFHPMGEGGSGDSNFARHGLAGASNQWNCPAFASVVYFDRKVPPKWPSGVYWINGNTRSELCTYERIGLKPDNDLQIKIKEGKAFVRVFDI
jgi:hypothetical protein